MPEHETEEKDSSETKYPSPLKRFILTLVGLFIFVILFGEIVPRLMFAQKNKPATNIQESPGKSIESHIDPVTEQAATGAAEIPSSLPSPDNHEIAASEPAVENPVSNSPPAATTTEPAASQSSEKDKEQLRELEQKITTLQATHEAAISELRKKLETQSAESQHKSNSVISSLIIFGQLKDAVASGKPYDEELSQLKKTTADNAEITKIISLIEPDADKGITVADKLKASFTPLVKQALTDNNESAWLKILHKFITIRKIGEQSGSTDEAILARAETKLAQNDLSATLSELDQLSPEAKEVFKGWRENAQKLLDAHKALSNLQLLLTKTNQAMQP